MKRLFASVLLIVLTGCSNFSAKYTRSIEESFTVSGPIAVDVSTFNGGVTVESGDVSNIDIKASITAYGVTEEAARVNCDQIDYSVTEQDQTFVLEATRPSVTVQGAVAFHLTVPLNSNLKIKTSNGTVAVNSRQGNVDISTSNGSVTCENIVGPLDVNTSNGRVAVKNCIGEFQLRSSNGKIQYAGQPVGDNNKIGTSNGTVSVELATGTPVHIAAKTSNGKVRCEAQPFEIIEKGKRSLEGIVGDVTTDVPASSLSIKTSNGSVSIKSLATEQNMSAEMEDAA